jgi:hypothetical protein
MGESQGAMTLPLINIALAKGAHATRAAANERIEAMIQDSAPAKEEKELT